MLVAGLPNPDDDSSAHIVLTRSDGMTTEAQGSLLGATQLANELGLTLLHTSDGTFRWERLPQTWDEPVEP